MKVKIRIGNEVKEYTGAWEDHTLLEVFQELGITQVLIPCYAGILSSFGLLVADIIRDYVQTRLCSCDTTSTEDIATFFAGIEERAIRDMESYGFRKEQLQFSYGDVTATPATIDSVTQLPIGVTPTPVP